MSRHRVSTSPFLSSSSALTTQLHYINSHLNLNFLQHYTDTLTTRNVVCRSGAWFENRPHSTPTIRLVRNPKRVIVQWVGIKRHTLGIIIEFLPGYLSSGEKPWWNWYLTLWWISRKSGGPRSPDPLSSLPRCCPWDLLWSFKVCSDAKERMGCGKQREATAPINP